MVGLRPLHGRFRGTCRLNHSLDVCRIGPTASGPLARRAEGTGRPSFLDSHLQADRVGGGWRIDRLAALAALLVWFSRRGNGELEPTVSWWDHPGSGHGCRSPG